MHIIYIIYIIMGKYTLHRWRSISNFQVRDKVAHMTDIPSTLKALPGPVYLSVCSGQALPGERAWFPRHLLLLLVQLLDQESFQRF